MTLTELLPPLLQGAKVTAEITLASTLAGGALAFAGGLGRLARWRAARWLATLYVEIFRGTSLLVQLFWLFYALPLLGLDLSPLTAGIVGLSLNIGAYGAEVVRGAMQSVPTGQIEAAIALDFSPAQILWRIKLPQALVEMIPPFGNLAVQNLKDSALVSLITLADLTYQAQNLRNFTLQTVPIFSLTLVMYFLMSLVLMLAMRWLEGRMERLSGRRA